MNQPGEQNIGLEEVHVGVNDAEIIQLLFKNMINQYLYKQIKPFLTYYLLQIQLSFLKFLSEVNKTSIT